MLNVQVLDLSDRFGYLEVSRCSERRRSCKYPSAPQTAARQGSHMCSGSHVFRKEGETQSTGRHWGEQGEMYVKGYMRKCAEERQLVTDLHRQVGLDSCRDTCRGWARDWWRHIETQARVREERFLECTRRGPNTGLMGLQEKAQRWHPQEPTAQLPDHTLHSCDCCFGPSDIPPGPPLETAMLDNF